MNFSRLSRRDFIRLSSAAVLASSCSVPGKSRLDGLSIVFVLVDDLRPWLSSYGFRVAKTPNIDRLSERSHVFLDAFAQAPDCPCSRNSMFTGLYPTAERFSKFESRMDSDAPEVPTLPELLKKYRVSTFSFGKVFHAARDRLSSWDINTHWIGARAGFPGYMQLGGDGKFQGNESQEPHIFPSTREILDLPETEFLDWKFAAAAREELERQSRGGNQFFCGIGLRRPHLPFVIPKKYWDLYSDDDADALSIDILERPVLRRIFGQGSREFQSYRDIPLQGQIPLEKQRELKRGYLAAMSFADAALGQILDVVHTTELKHRTAIVLTTDHGTALGEYGYYGKGILIPEMLKVPLLISLPQTTGQTLISSPVGLIDVYPTLCDIAGLSRPPVHCNGTSLSDLLAANSTVERQAAYARTGVRFESLLTATHQLIREHGANGNRVDSLFLRSDSFSALLPLGSELHASLSTTLQTISQQSGNKV